MEENNRDDKYMRLIKWGFILMIIAYVAVVLGVTIYQINRGDYNIDDFVFNFFGGLIVIPFFIVLLFIIGGVMTIIEKITKKKGNNSEKAKSRMGDIQRQSRERFRTSSRGRWTSKMESKIKEHLSMYTWCYNTCIYICNPMPNCGRCRELFWSQYGS